MAGNAGAGFVELVPKIGAGFASQAASELEGPMRGIGSKIGAILGAAVAAAGAVGIGKFLKGSADEFATVGGEVLKVQRLTGLGAESASKLRFAAEESGVGVDQLSTSLGILSKHIAAGDKAAASIGVSFKDAQGKARPLDTVLGDIAEKFKNMPDGVQKNALAMSIFGRSGKDLIPFLDKGRDGLAELSAEAEKFGLVLTQDNIDAVKKNVEGQRQFQAALSGLRVQLGQYVLPLLTKGTLFFTRFALKGVDIARRAVTIFRGALDPRTEIDDLTGWEKIVGLLAKGFAQVVDWAKQFFAGLRSGNADINSATTLFEKLGVAVSDIFDGLVALVRGDTSNFADLVATAFDNPNLIAPLKRFADAVTGFITGIGKLIHGDIAGWAVDVATGLGFTEDSRVTNGLIRIGNAVKSAFEWLFSHLDLLARVGEIVGGLIIANKVAGGIFDISRAVGDLLPKLNPANTQLGQLVQLIGKVAGKSFSVAVDVGQAAGGAASDIGNSIAQAVSTAISKALKTSLTGQAESAGISAASQTLADRLAEQFSKSLLPALGAALGAVFAEAAPAAATFLAEVIGAALLTAMEFAVSIPGLITIFHFFGNQIVGFFENTVGPALGRFFTHTLPHIIGQALGLLAGLLVTLYIVVPLRVAQLIIQLVPKIVGAFVHLGETVASAVVGFFEKLPGRIERFLVALPGIFLKVVTSILNFVIRLPENLPRYIEDAVSGMVHFFEGLPDAIGGILSRSLSAVGKFLVDLALAVAHFPLTQAIADFFSSLADGFVKGWNQIDDMTGGALSQIADLIGGFFSGVASFFSGLFSAVGAVWNAGWTALSTFFTTWWALVTGIVSGAVDLIVSTISTELSILGGVWSAIWGVLGGVVSAVWSVVTSVVTTAWGVVYTVLSTGLGILEAYWSAVWGAVQAVIQTVWGVVTAVVGTGVNFVTSVVSGAVNVLTGIWNGFWGALAGVVSGAWAAVIGLVTGAINGIVGFFSGLPGRLAGVLGNVFEPLWDGFRRIIDLIIGGWNSLHFGFDLPSVHIPGTNSDIGGGHVDVGVPKLPLLDTGGRVLRGGLAVIDPYHELVNLPSGASVEPLGKAEPTTRDPQIIQVPVTLDGERIAYAEARYSPRASRRHRRSRQ